MFASPTQLKEHIYYRRRRNRNIVLYSACRFQLHLQTEFVLVLTCIAQPPDNLGNCSSLDVPG